MIAGVTIMLLAVWLVFNWLAPLAALRGAVRLSLGRIPGEIVQRAGAERVEFYQAVLDRGYAFSIWSWPHQFVVLDRGFALHAHPAQVRFVLAHELGHCALGHLRRRWLAAVTGAALCAPFRRRLVRGEEEAADAYAEALTGLPRAVLREALPPAALDVLLRGTVNGETDSDDKRG